MSNYQEPQQEIGEEQLARLAAAAGEGPVLIMTHDNPDPDALASGKALAYLLQDALGISSRLVYCGVVERAENAVMLNLVTPEWQQQTPPLPFGTYSTVALVDTQPGAGNNGLPVEITPGIVIDHHLPRRQGLASVPFVDVRPEIGATVSLVFQYLEAAGLEPDPALATAMFYGLKTDTRGLSRGASHLDETIYLKLLNRLDRQSLRQIEQAGLSRDYFRAFSHGLRAARVYGHSVFAFLGEMSRPDLAAELSDLLIRLEDSEAALCLGHHGGMLYISLRTRRHLTDAGELIQTLVPPPGMAGGHGGMAGGQLPITGGSIEMLVNDVRKRFLAVQGESGEGTPLVID
jgi:nanoRNase/pAp phosphatase (c-di-AMP/oligoRNAs hydrolase)